MANKNEMTDDHYISLQTDVKSILDLLEGSKRFNRMGLLDEVSENTHEIKRAKIERNNNRQNLNNFKTKIVAYTAGATAVATALIQGMVAYFF